MELFEALAALTTSQTVLLFVALVIAIGFECINGFHDTVNAVATVIYTKPLKPTQRSCGRGYGTSSVSTRGASAWPSASSISFRSTCS
jgi:hypothetical protein